MSWGKNNPSPLEGEGWGEGKFDYRSRLGNGEHGIAIGVMAMIRRPDQDSISLLHFHPQFVDRGLKSIKTGINTIKATFRLDNPLRQPTKSDSCPNRRQKKAKPTPATVPSVANSAAVIDSSVHSMPAKVPPSRTPIFRTGLS